MAMLAKTMVDPVWESVHDLLLPELNAIRVSVDTLRGEVAALRGQLEQATVMTSAFADPALRSDFNPAPDSVADLFTEIRVRLAAIEGRLPSR